MRMTKNYNELAEVIQDVEYETYNLLRSHKDIINFVTEGEKIDFVCETLNDLGVNDYPRMRQDAKEIVEEAERLVDRQRR